MKYTIFFIILMFSACQNNSSNIIEKDEPLTIKFDRSDIFISKNCESLTKAKIFVKSKISTDQNLDFEVKFEEDYLAEWSLSPKLSKEVKFMPNRLNKGTIEIEIPAFAKYKKPLVHCTVQCITNGYQAYSKSIAVHYVDFDNEFEFIESKGGFTDLLEQRFWDNYEGPPLPAERSYILQHNLKDRIYKDNGQYFQKMNYQLTLIDEETKEEIQIKPDLILKHTFSEKLDLKTRTKISDSNSDDNMMGMGVQTIAKYTTNSHPNQVPGYQIYGSYEGDFIRAKYVNCDSMVILDKEKLTIPNRIMFKSFPRMN